MGLQVTFPAELNEILQQSLNLLGRLLGNSGRIYIRIFPQRSATAQPAETRMGKGKGDIEYWFAEVKPGTVLFEIAGVSAAMAQQAFRRQAYKLPVKTCMTERRHTI